MTFPVSAGSTSYGGTASTSTFIPEIWSSKLLAKFYDATVLAQISNTDYEGEIRNQGDTVHMRTVPTLAINDYNIGQTLVNQRPTSNMIDLLIDKGKYWSAIVDDVVEVQTDINMMNMWAGDASEQMKIAIDSVVLGSIAADIDAANQGATAGRISGNINLGATGAPLALTRVNVLDTIVDLGQILDEQNIPETGRYIVMPFWATAMLKKSDLKDAMLTGDSVSPLRNGRLGMIDRFTVYQSNNLPSVTDGAVQAFNIFAGHKQALTFASQLVKTETLRAETTFGNIMRGLQVFGFKVTLPTSIATAYVYKG